MENINLNLPPFYVGQKVVYISDNGMLPKNSEWTVLGLFRHMCGHWAIDIGRKADLHFWKRCGICDAVTEATPEWQHIHVGRATSFAPIEERFISFAEVIEIESPLIGAN